MRMIIKREAKRRQFSFHFLMTFYAIKKQYSIDKTSMVILLWEEFVSVTTPSLDKVISYLLEVSK